MKKGIQKIAHQWNLNLEGALALQTKLAPGVIRKSRIQPAEIATVAGVDAGYGNDRVYAAAAVVNLTDLRVVEKAVASKPLRFPYVSGMLAFREGPAILEALAKLKSRPDLLIVDGQGIAHPRRFGIASHIGLLTDMPSIGCAKTVLTGDYQEPLSPRGSISYLIDGDETIGAVVRTRTAVKPVFASIGHLMNLSDSIQIILKSCRGYRLPEPIRRADHLSRKQIIV